MSRLHLPIQDPCHENWDAMNHEGDARRFCESCTKHVHDLSAMTERKARSVLAIERAKGRVCVRYTADNAGNIKFAPDMAPAPSIWRMTLAAASMTLALLTGCTDTAPDEIQTDRCVYEFGPWGFTAARGEGTCPAVEEPEHEMLGKISIEPDPVVDPEPIPTMGEAPMLDPVPEPRPVKKMGKIAMDPDPEPAPIEHQLMGDIAAPDMDNKDDKPCDPQPNPQSDPPHDGPRRL